MLQPQYVQSDALFLCEANELLDISSLNTVLDMLAVIDSAEELALLEMLTPAQKRQVWDATPTDLKLKLKQIRAKVSHPSPEPSQKTLEQLPPSSHGSESFSEHLAAEPFSPVSIFNQFSTEAIADNPAEPVEQVGAIELALSSVELDLELVNQDRDELEELDDLTQLTEEQTQQLDLQHKLEHELQSASVLHYPAVQVGDRIVLLAKPFLTPTELKAVWEVVSIDDNLAQIHTPGLTDRIYPMTWMVIYPEPEF